MFFTFPEDARWDAERQAVEFGIETGEYQGVVRVPRRVFQRLLPEQPRGASKPTASNGPGSSVSSSENSAHVGLPRMGTVKISWRELRQVYEFGPSVGSLMPRT
jgi:hypothetical protein